MYWLYSSRGVISIHVYIYIYIHLFIHYTHTDFFWNDVTGIIPLNRSRMAANIHLLLAKLRKAIAYVTQCNAHIRFHHLFAYLLHIGIQRKHCSGKRRSVNKSEVLDLMVWGEQRLEGSSGSMNWSCICIFRSTLYTYGRICYMCVWINAEPL